MPEVPADLQSRFDRWNADGRPEQESFSWNAANWSRQLGEYEILSQLPNPLGRADVVRVFEQIDSPAAALDAYIASYLWGYANAGFGPYRAARVIAANSAPSSHCDFAEDLFELAGVARTEGGVAAYAHVAKQREASRSYFRHWGPAFGTKFISYATKASSSPEVITTPIMDSVVQRWFAHKSDGAGELVLDWRSVNSYRRYSEHAAEWGETLGIEPDQVEQLIFRRDRA